jgi:hypothetical protein
VTSKNLVDPAKEPGKGLVIKARKREDQGPVEVISRAMAFLPTLPKKVNDGDSDRCETG